MLDDPTIDKLGSLLVQLGATRVADRAAAAAEADRLLQSCGTDWGDFVALLRGALGRDGWRTPPWPVQACGWQPVHWIPGATGFWLEMPDGMTLNVMFRREDAHWTATVNGEVILWNQRSPYLYLEVGQAMRGALLRYHEIMVGHLR